MRDLLRVLLITGIIFLCKFIDWREQCEQRYPAFDQDWWGYAGGAKMVRS